MKTYIINIYIKFKDLKRIRALIITSVFYILNILLSPLIYLSLAYLNRDIIYYLISLFYLYNSIS